MKPLNSVIILSVFLAGCAPLVDSQKAEEIWLNKFESCQEIATSNRISMPDSAWFDSLDRDDKKTVIGYLANYTDRKCIGPATDTLRQALLAENNQRKLDYYAIDITPLRELAKERIKHLNKNELKRLQNKMNKPFNLSYMIEKEGLY